MVVHLINFFFSWIQSNHQLFQRFGFTSCHLIFQDLWYMTPVSVLNMHLFNIFLLKSSPGDYSSALFYECMQRSFLWMHESMSWMFDHVQLYLCPWWSTTSPLWLSSDSNTLSIHHQLRFWKWLVRREQELYLQVGTTAELSHWVLNFQPIASKVQSLITAGCVIVF